MKSNNRLRRILGISLFAGALLAFCPENIRGDEAGEREALMNEAARNFSTDEGRSYFQEFEKAILPTLRKALEECGKITPDTEEPVDFVFVIAADGAVKRFLYSSNIPFGKSVGARLAAIKSVPRPPRDSWVVALGAANHRHAGQTKAPPDREIHAEGKDLADMEKAMAPYIAEARATYPAAKARFLEGLPAGNTFSVQIQLIQQDGKREHSFVRIESIKDQQITGIIDNRLNLVTEFKMGERITFPETKIDNWVIVRPDGSEEGNPVGKFLDTYKTK